MAAGHSPLAQFEVKSLYTLPELGGVDMSITNSALFMILSVIAVGLFFGMAMRKKAMVPGRLQSFGEVIYQFVYTIVEENAGQKGLKYFPVMFTFFLFILAMNLLGMIPHSFAPTSHIIVTFGLGAAMFVFILLVNIIKQGPVNFLKHFVPPGLPLWIAPVIFCIEVVTFLSRPLSLAIRLAANIGAGHTLMKVMAGFVVPAGAAVTAGTVAIGIFPMLFLVFMTGFEFFVAILQAYVFTLLSCLYLGEALVEHHDEHDHFDHEHVSI
jgi:F-type H+-transporting ATPase subunit a